MRRYWLVVIIGLSLLLGWPQPATSTVSPIATPTVAPSPLSTPAQTPTPLFCSDDCGEALAIRLKSFGATSP